MGDAEQEPESIKGLFAQLADDAGAMMRAEVELYRALALHRLALSQQALIFLGSALLIVQAAIGCLLVMLAIGLSRWIGPIGSGLVVTVIALTVAGLLGRMGIQRLSKPAADKKSEERQ